MSSGGVALRQRLERRLELFRLRTHALIAPLGDDDLHRQYDPIMSPMVWDVGHVANFEELWLLREVAGRAPRDEKLDRLYNPFDNPRWTRGELPVLELPEALEYLADVRSDALSILRRLDLDPGRPLLLAGYVYSMTAQHEAQHQETMLQALDLRRDLAPYGPARARSVPSPRRVDDTDRVMVAAGPFVLGTDDRTAAYDNERPAHPANVDAFEIDRFPATVRRYAQFVAEGGYGRQELWSTRGWAWRRETGEEAPQGWIPDGAGGWLVRRFGRVVALDLAEPVQHLSYWEAEAFARWSGGRLPTEPEWEKAARWDPRTRRPRTYPWGEEPPGRRHTNLDQRAWGPAPVGSYPDGASAYGLEQLVGDVHEWTSSPFEAYPGYSTFPYPEYSEVFFGGDYRVLRGSSWASAALVGRATFRNWDHPQRRQIFSGVRVAYDVEAR